MRKKHEAAVRFGQLWQFFNFFLLWKMGLAYVS